MPTKPPAPGAKGRPRKPAQVKWQYYRGPAVDAVSFKADRSVVNAWGRSHDVRNLFIVDGSVFVTGGGVNPTSSIQAIALNEQRNAPNIKNVVSADEFGDIGEGNLGEFMKYLPSVTADFADPTILSISVRGLNAHLTTVTADGAPHDVLTSDVLDSTFGSAGRSR